MLLTENTIVNYKKETFNKKSFIIKVLLSSIIAATLLAFIFLKPFIVVNYMAYNAADNQDFVTSHVDIIESRIAKLNKGTNYLIYNERFFWHPNDRSVSFTNKYDKEKHNIIMTPDLNKGTVDVTIKNIPDISCSAFSNYIQQKHGNVIIKSTDGKNISECPSGLKSLFSSSKYNFYYIIKSKKAS